jgi:hypothetical protein
MSIILTTGAADVMFVIREDDYHDDMTIGEAAKLAVPRDEVERAYDDMLLALGGPIDIIGLEFEPGEALRRLEPDKYEICVNDFQSQEYRELYAGDLPPGDAVRV